ncbi:hypothetical protein [Allomuricauda sp. d1]|uniref:hypothetical protein n=1 Tax=Allomuricauda sp. d1 TaxID=3136725 RepID=UPI0031DDBA30
MLRSNFILTVIAISIFGCKTDKKQVIDNEEESLPIIEKIANAHGYDDWKAVKSIKFTFNVDRDSTHFERSWIWKPKTNEITSISGQDTLTYLRKQMDSTAYKANAGFINDRYWLLAPFNLIWDKNSYEYEHTTQATAPISGQPMQKLTIVYANEGGYTPGDAYDFYFGDDHLIQEWTFRKGNQAEPSMSTTWENYTEQKGLTLALDHKKKGEPFNLYFTGVEIK